MKILAISDFHGKIPGKLKDKIKKLGYDIILCPGDLMDTDRSRKVEWKHYKAIKEEGKSLKEILTKKQYANFVQVIKEEIKTTQPVLDFLSNLRKPVYLVYGNCDATRRWEKDFKIKGIEYRAKKAGINLLIRKFVKTKGYGILGLSGYRFPEEKGLIDNKHITSLEIKEENKKWDKNFKNLFRKIKCPEKTIVLFHDPPRNCMDKVKNKASDLYGRHVGDEILKKYLKRYQPLLCVCGHMHEYQGTCKIGRTTVINPGPAYKGKAALIEIEKEKINKINFIK